MNRISTMSPTHGTFSNELPRHPIAVSRAEREHGGHDTEATEQEQPTIVSPDDRSRRRPRPPHPPPGNRARGARALIPTEPGQSDARAVRGSLRFQKLVRVFPYWEMDPLDQIGPVRWAGPRRRNHSG